MYGRGGKNGWRGYFCSTRRYKGSAVCNAPSINTKVIEPDVISFVEEFLTRSDPEAEMLPRIDLQRESRLSQIDSLQSDTGQQLSEIASQVEQILSALGKQAQLDIVRERLDKLQAENDELESELEKLDAERAMLLRGSERSAELVRQTRDFASNWESADQASKKKIISSLVDRIVVQKNGRVEITLTF